MKTLLTGKKYSHSSKTDIRRTWVNNWPKEAQDKVWERIKAQVDAMENCPPTLQIVMKEAAR